MKLPAEVIREALVKLGEWHLTEEKPDISYAFPRQNDGSVLSSGHVIILPAESDPQNLSHLARTLAVCTNPSQADVLLRETRAAVLVPSSPVSADQIMTCLSAFFDRMNAWEDRLNECSPDLTGVQEMIDLSSLEMKGFFTLVDESYHMPAWTKVDLRRIGIRQFWTAPRLDDKIIAQLAEDPQLSSIRSVRGVQLYENQMTEQTGQAPQSLYRNLFRLGEDSYYNRLLFVNGSGLYSQTERFMLEVLAGKIEQITRHLPTFSLPSSERNVLRRMLIRLAHTDSIKEGEAAKAISLLGWSIEDPVRFYIFRSLYPDRDPGISDYILRRLEALIPSSCGAVDGQTILLVQNTSRSGGAFDAVRQKLAPFLAENLYRAGISNETSTFRQIRGALLQARAAIRLGEKRDPMFWYFLFSDYLPDYLAERAVSEIPGDLLTPPQIRTLQAWDKEHGTSLTETLRVLLIENFNVTHAAKRLYIHRTSLQDRIGRIRSVTGLDLEDGRTRFILQLGFYMAEGLPHI